MGERVLDEVAQGGAHRLGIGPNEDRPCSVDDFKMLPRRDGERGKIGGDVSRDDRQSTVSLCGCDNVSSLATSSSWFTVRLMSSTS